MEGGRKEERKKMILNYIKNSGSQYNFTIKLIQCILYQTYL